ncbi:hypothetical protein ABID97_003644 [Variovorax sp. OAS795]|uniref:hypothetical protein n=1 Tax=Variovorax sp. OAS795 TaxID=3034231 RepID=UPI003399CB32
MAAGVAWWPAFVAQGVYVGTHGAPFDSDPAAFGGTSRLADESLFGANFLFSPRGNPTCDADFDGNDHELVSHRLRWLIANSTVVEGDTE